MAERSVPIHGRIVLPPPITRIRKDINTLTPGEMDLLIYAWDYIQKQEPDEVMKHLIDNPKTNSFFTIASFHGEPFRGAGYGNPNWWGGYCNHGNILFPTWHRAYLLCLEDALRRVNYNGINCKDVALPYWNQLSGSNPDKPIPWIFLNKKYTYQTILKNGRNKTTIDNPLYSYRFQKPVHDRLRPIPDADYSKPNGYETVRYPFSGLVGDSDASTTESHNDLMKMLGEEKTTDLLQSNVSNWLLDEVMNDKGQSVGGHTQDRYIQSLFVPYYTVYSNLTSAQQYNDDNFSGNSEEDSEGDSEGNSRAAVPIESPHNAIHLAVGGFEIPNYDYSFVPGANGDMGENDTAAFDPIFYFHHCFIDLMFWAWQLKQGKETELDLWPKYPGTNSVDSQGPTPGILSGSWLDLDTPLDPFINPITHKPLTSHDVTNIVALGYNYDGLAKDLSELPLPASDIQRAHIRIGDISRADAKGSFYVTVWASDPGGDRQLVAVEPVLSRWHVAGCANCSTHLNITAIASLPMGLKDAQQKNFEILVHTRSKASGHPMLGGKKPSFRLGTVLFGH